MQESEELSSKNMIRNIRSVSSCLDDGDDDNICFDEFETGVTTDLSDASGAQSIQKKKNSKQAVHDPVKASVIDCGYSSLVPTASSSKQITMATPQGSVASGELISGVMQPVQSRKRKEKESMAAASVNNADRSCSPLKKLFVNSTSHQFPRFPSHSQNDFQARNSSAVDPLQLLVASTGVQFGAGPNLRYIILDGSNIAMKHGKGKEFSCWGIQLAVKFFQDRGHSKITVFVPHWCCQGTSKHKYPMTEQSLLKQLYKDGLLEYSPSRGIPVGNRMRNIVPYDDRIILQLAVETRGIVVSNDNYRDLYGFNQDFNEVIEKRLVQYTLVEDFFIVPQDPLGPDGPTLDQFLSVPLLTPLSVPAPEQRFIREMVQPYFDSSSSSKPGFSGWVHPPSDIPSTTSTTRSSWPSLHNGTLRTEPVSYKPDSAHRGFPSRMNQPSRPRLNQPNQWYGPMTTPGGPQRSDAYSRR